MKIVGWVDKLFPGFAVNIATPEENEAFVTIRVEEDKVEDFATGLESIAAGLRRTASGKRSEPGGTVRLNMSLDSEPGEEPS